MNKEILPILEAANSHHCSIFDRVLDHEGSNDTPTMVNMRQWLNQCYNDLLKVRNGANDHVKLAYAKSYCARVRDFAGEMDMAPEGWSIVEAHNHALVQLIDAATAKMQQPQTPTQCPKLQA